jgi:PPP family 3-phenylpropionic acid transporter
MRRILNCEYGGLHAAYWMSFAVITSFASAFLLSRGYTNSEIGIILAAGSMVAVFLQPFLADVADRSKRVSLIGVIKGITILTVLLMFICFAMKKESLSLSILFTMMLAWNTSLQPLLNSLAFKLEESGNKISFGAGRAMGSLFFAILCLFLGSWVEKFGTQVLLITGETVLIMLLITLWFMKNHFEKACKAHEQICGGKNLSTSINNQEDINLIEFAKRNKLFMLVNVGVAGIFFSNATFNSFMLQIAQNVGGSSEDMGRIFAIMAFVELPPMFLFERIHRRFSCKTILKFGAICFTVKILVAYLATNITMVYISQLFQLGSFGVFLPAMVSFIDEIMEKGEAVKGQALYTVVITIATIFSSLVGGFIIDLSGVSALLLLSTLITGAGAFLFIMAVGGVKVRKCEIE